MSGLRNHQFWPITGHLEVDAVSRCQLDGTRPTRGHGRCASVGSSPTRRKQSIHFAGSISSDIMRTRTGPSLI
jgi:hypothetical protein